MVGQWFVYCAYVRSDWLRGTNNGKIAEFGDRYLNMMQVQ